MSILSFKAFGVGDLLWVLERLVVFLGSFFRLRFIYGFCLCRLEIFFMLAYVASILYVGFMFSFDVL